VPIASSPADHDLAIVAFDSANRERGVLELRYGLGGEHPRTLDEVGRTFNLTRERIRQIENHSLKKLQQLREARMLRDTPDHLQRNPSRISSQPQKLAA
jgi:Sigma-70, region 4